MSYFEWVQGLQYYFWRESEITSRLQEVMTRAFNRVWASASKEGSRPPHGRAHGRRPAGGRRLQGPRPLPLASLHPEGVPRPARRGRSGHSEGARDHEAEDRFGPSVAGLHLMRGARSEAAGTSLWPPPRARPTHVGRLIRWRTPDSGPDRQTKSLLESYPRSRSAPGPPGRVAWGVWGALSWPPISRRGLGGVRRRCSRGRFR